MEKPVHNILSEENKLDEVLQPQSYPKFNDNLHSMSSECNEGK